MMFSLVVDRNIKSKCNNEFIRRDTWLQVMDMLTGQVDKHRSNVMLTSKGHPIGIDHDLSFPTNPPRKFAHIISPLLDKAIDNVFSRNYAMPPIIDREMYEVIKILDLEQLKNMYQECGLTRGEIDAAMDRALNLKELVEDMKTQNKVIEPSIWKRHADLCDETNSYAKKHMARV